MNLSISHKILDTLSLRRVFYADFSFLVSENLCKTTTNRKVTKIKINNFFIKMHCSECRKVKIKIFHTFYVRKAASELKLYFTLRSSVYSELFK